MEAHLVKLIQKVIGELQIRLVDLINNEHHLLRCGKSLAELSQFYIGLDV